MFQRILVPWDGSELGDRALATAVELAGRYDAEIVVASVLTGEATGDARDRLQMAFARDWGDGRRDRMLIGHEVLAGRDPTAVLLDFAHEHGFDLVVIGHHRDPRPGHLGLHGLTQHLLAAAEIPVLVVGSA